MKYVLIIVSLTLFLKPVFPVLEYFVNYDYITTELCENQAKPELNCNGKCHLEKELAKASESDTTNSSEKKVVAQQYEIIYFQDIEILTFNQVAVKNTSKVLNVYSNSYNHLASNGTFHPPTV